MENDVYKEMYFRLFNRTTDIIQQLKAAQAEAEDICIFATDLPTKEKELGER